MAKHYKTDGTITDLTPANGSDFTLAELQTAVGGFIEVLPLQHTGGNIVVNEEGKLTNLPPNWTATAVWTSNYGPTDVIVGDALVCSPSEIR